MARFMRTDLGPGHSKLKPPAAVGQGVVFPPIQGYLFPVGDVQLRVRQRKAESRLGPPKVITAPVAFVARPLKVELAPSPRQARAPHPNLAPPVVIDLSPQVKYVTVSLAYSRRGTPTSRLKRPSVVVAPPVFAGPHVTLVRQPLQVRFARCFTGATSERRVVRTNLVANGGFESGTARWTTVGSTTFLGSSPGLFGNSCGRMVTDGLGPNEGAYAEFVADGRPVTVSVYLQRTGAGSAVQLAVTDSLGGNGQQGASFTPGLEWARYSFTTTPLPSGVWRFYIQTAGTSALILLVDGAQAESGTITTPYIETDGAPASSPRSDIFGYERCIGPQLPRVLEQFFDRNIPQVTLVPSPRQARVPHSRLRPPTVIDLTPQTKYLSVGLAYSRRGRPKSRLYPPTVIAAVGAAVYPGPKVTVARRPSRPVQQPVLGRPIVVSVLAALGGVGIQLVQTPRTRTLHRLNPPTVVTAPVTAVFFGPQTALAYSRRGVAGPLLSPPAVINTDRYFGPATTLAPTVRTTTRSRLFPPTVTVAEAKVENTILVRLAPSTRGVAKSRLFAPQSVGEGVVFPPIFGTLFPLGYQNLPRAKSILHPPVVVTQPPPVVVYYGPSVHLARQVRTRTAAILRRPTVVDLTPQVFYLSVALTRIRPPAVHSLLSPSAVTEALPRAERDLRVTLAYSVRGKPKSTLRKPVVIDLRPQAVYLSVNLTYSKRGKARYGLAAPAVVFIEAPPLARPLLVHLAYSVRRPGEALLRKPAVVGPVLANPLLAHLTYSRRGRPLSVLRKPTVIDLRPQVYYLRVELTRIKPPPTISFLRPSMVTEALPSAERDLRVVLAYSVRGKPKSLLKRPTVIDLRPQVYYLGVTLAPSRRGRPLSELKPPVVVEFKAVFLGPSVTLAASRRGVTESHLRPPTVIDLRPQVYYLRVELTRIKHPSTQSFLRPSTVTEALPRAERELRITLAYQSRGKPKSVLRKPTVIDLRPQTRFLNVTLAYSRRGRPISFLRRPIFPPLAEPTRVTLAYSLRGKPISVLKPPTVVETFLARPTKIKFAYQSRRRGETFLRPPTVIRYEAFFGPRTTLIRILPVPVATRLLPPTRVLPFIARPLAITFVRITPPQRFWKLQPPTAVAGAVLHPITVKLAPSTRPQTKYGLAPPAVVAIPEPVLYPVRIALVEIRPPQRFWILQPPAAVRTFIPPQGDVCGSDEAGSDICGDDQPDTPNMTIVGGDGTDDSVCGGDEENT